MGSHRDESAEQLFVLRKQKACVNRERSELWKRTPRRMLLRWTISLGLGSAETVRDAIYAGIHAIGAKKGMREINIDV